MILEPDFLFTGESSDNVDIRHDPILPPRPHLRAAINAQLALWDALRALEHAAGERANPSWDDFVVKLAVGCDASADELSDDQIASATSVSHAP